MDSIKTFKPNPEVYAYLVNRRGCSREETWVVSSNPFDVIGAKAARLKAAWVKRNPEAIFDPWKFEPDIVVGDLTALATALGRPA